MSEKNEVEIKDALDPIYWKNNYYFKTNGKLCL